MSRLRYWWINVTVAVQVAVLTIAKNTVCLFSGHAHRFNEHGEVLKEFYGTSGYRMCRRCWHVPPGQYPPLEEMPGIVKMKSEAKEGP